jgi:Cu-Zn family superoxide dismutase
MLWKTIAGIALATALGGCGSTTVGVGVGGVSGNVGAGVAVSTPVSRTAQTQLTVAMFKVDAAGVGGEIGTLRLAATDRGLRIEPALGALPPGDHGFHLHEKGSCEPAEKDGRMQAALGAGAHFDPATTGKHLGPEGGGHKGDLPRLRVDASGNATEVMFVPHLKLADVRGRAFVIHAGGDNYSDTPQPLGGGGARIACGVVS